MKLSYLCRIFGCMIVLWLAASAAAQTLQVSPNDTLFFGRIPEGKTAVRNVTLYNTSTTALNISAIRLEGSGSANFSVLNNPGAVSVAGFQKLILDIQFKPKTVGHFTTWLLIESNASGSPHRVVLSGYGTGIKWGFIAFERIMGQPESDSGSSVRQTSDGGYIIGGGIQQLERIYGDAALIKLDMYGQTEWRQIHGIEDWSEGFSETIPTSDGGYISSGSKSHSKRNVPSDLWVVKTDATGSKEWDYTYGGNENDGGNYIIETSDGGYLISGFYQNDTAQRQDSDALLLKLNANGTLAWAKTYGGESGGEEAGQVRETADGGYIFSGSTSSYGAGEWDVYAVKTDAGGTEQWHKTYGGTDWDNGGAITQTADGGYVFGGWTSNFGVQARDMYLVKTNEAGTQTWYKTFGDTHKDGVGDVIQTSDGGYVVVGSTENTYFNLEWLADGQVMKLSSQGNLVWSRTFGGEQNEGFGSVRETSDGGYIICGNARSYYNSNEIYLIKMNRDGVITSVDDGPGAGPDAFVLAQNYPNPFNSQTSIHYSIPERTHVNLTVYNIQGQMVARLVDGMMEAGTFDAAWDARDLSTGMYIYQLKAGDFSQTKRMLLLK